MARVTTLVNSLPSRPIYWPVVDSGLRGPVFSAIPAISVQSAGKFCVPAQQFPRAASVRASPLEPASSLAIRSAEPPRVATAS
jgi:hypothetical protein